jgi:hypothetical protein
MIRGGDDAELTRARPIATIWFRTEVDHTLYAEVTQQKEYCFMNQEKKILVEVFSDYI